MRSRNKWNKKGRMWRKSDWENSDEKLWSLNLIWKENNVKNNKEMKIFRLRNGIKFRNASKTSNEWWEDHDEIFF